MTAPVNGLRANAARLASQGPPRPAIGHIPFPGRTVAEVWQFEDWQRRGTNASLEAKWAYNAAIQARQAGRG